jgi:DNA-binding NtrC family response regulator
MSNPLPIESPPRRSMRQAVTLPRIRHAEPRVTARAPDEKRARFALLVEDDDEMRALLAALLRRDGWTVMACADAEELWRRVQARGADPTLSGVDLVIADVALPGASGLDLLEWIEAERLGIPVVLISAFADLDTRIAAAQHHAAALFSKPFPLERLRSAVRAIAGLR